MASNAINAGQGRYTEPYVSTGQLIQTDNLMFGTMLQRDERNYLDWMEYKMNYAAVSDFSIMRWHEQDLLRQNAQIGAVTGGTTPQGSIVITIGTNYSNGGQNSPFRQNDTFKIGRMDFYVQSKNTSVANAHTLTVFASTNSSVFSVALNTVVFAGQTMVPTGNQFGQGTSFVQGYVDLPKEYEEQLGITKTKNNITGSQATDKAKIPFAYSEKEYIIWESDIKTFVSHKGDVSFQLLLGNGGTGPGLDDAGNAITVPLMKGGVQQTKERGTVLGYYGALTLNDIMNWTRVMVTQGTGARVMGMLGHEARLNLTSMMTNQLKEGGKIYQDAEASKAEEMINFDWEVIKVGSQTIVLKDMPEFNHPTTTYVAGSPAPYYGWLVPDKMVTDAATKEKGYSMQVGYKKGTGPHGLMFDRKFEFKITGWNAPVYPTSEVDESNFTYLTECGLALTCGNQTILADNLLI